jgi:maleate isomerase
MLSFGEEVEARVARIDPRSTAEAARALAWRGGMDALFLSCTNLRTYDILPALQAELGLPVLSSNQALAWHMARLAGIPCDRSGSAR